MNSRVNKKRFVIWGWVVLLTQLCLIIIWLAAAAYVPDLDRSKCPRIEDYLGYDYEIKYSMKREELLKIKEYQDYQKALDEWVKSDEYQNYTRALNTKEAFLELTVYGFILLDLIFLFVIYIEKGRYLKLLALQSYQGEVKDKIKSNISSNKQTKNLSIATPKEIPYKTDINSAIEEELISNLGMTIIDAKKAIEYRQKNGNFTSIDEFFNSINAKPHIIAKLQEFIIIGENNKSEIKKQNNRRRVDI